MQIWNSILDWVAIHGGWGRIVFGAVIPFVAIVLAGIIAASIGRGSAKRLIAQNDRATRTAAVTAIISSARKATVWNTLSAPEQSHVDSLAGEADIRIRLLPIVGATLAADWATHEIADLKKNAVSFSFQAEQSMLNFRDRMVEWQAHPSRARKLFKNDLDAWAYDDSLADQDLVHQQQAWAAQQVDTTSAFDSYSAQDEPAAAEDSSIFAKTDAKI